MCANTHGVHTHTQRTHMHTRADSCDGVAVMVQNLQKQKEEEKRAEIIGDKQAREADLVDRMQVRVCVCVCVCACVRACVYSCTYMCICILVNRVQVHTYTHFMYIHPTEREVIEREGERARVRERDSVDRMQVHHACVCTCACVLLRERGRGLWCV